MVLGEDTTTTTATTTTTCGEHGCHRDRGRNGRWGRLVVVGEEGGGGARCEGRAGIPHLLLLLVVVVVGG